VQDLRVALAQVAPSLGDVAANVELHRQTIERAVADGAELIVFPELALTGYVLHDLVPEVAQRADSQVLDLLARASGSIDVVTGFVEEGSGYRFYNSAAYFSRGKLVHLHRKIYLPTYGMFQEGREFSPGEQLRGFESPHGPAGILICEDLWHQTLSWLLAQEGAELILGLSSGPTRGTRPDRRITSLAVWQELLQVTAQFLTAYLIYVNRVGCEDGLAFGGGSMVVDPFGRVVGTLEPLEEGLLTVQLEDEVLRRARSAYPLLRDENLELVHRELGRLRQVRFGLPPDEEPST